jgi:hypothetical protein
MADDVLNRAGHRGDQPSGLPLFLADPAFNFIRHVFKYVDTDSFGGLAELEQRALQRSAFLRR